MTTVALLRMRFEEKSLTTVPSNPQDCSIREAFDAQSTAHQGTGLPECFPQKISNIPQATNATKVHGGSNQDNLDALPPSRNNTDLQEFPRRKVFDGSRPPPSHYYNRFNSKSSVLRPSNCPEIAQEAANSRILSFGHYRQQFRPVYPQSTPQTPPLTPSSSPPRSKTKYQVPISPRLQFTHPRLTYTPSDTPTTPESAVSVSTSQASKHTPLLCRSSRIIGNHFQREYKRETIKARIRQRKNQRLQDLSFPPRLPATYRAARLFSFDERSVSLATSFASSMPRERYPHAVSGPEMELQAWQATVARGTVRRTMWAEERLDMFPDMMSVNRRVVGRAGRGGVGGSGALGTVGEDEEVVNRTVRKVQSGKEQKKQREKRGIWLGVVLGPITWVREKKIKRDKKRVRKLIEMMEAENR